MAAPPTSQVRPSVGRRQFAAASRAVPALAVIAGTAIALRVAYDPWYLNYDARYALLWARDIWHGFTPGFTALFASTPHPLSIAVSFLALPFGHDGDQLIAWMVLLSYGALVWLVYRLGATLFSPLVGAVAALVVLTRPVLARDAISGFQDIWFEALIVGAVLLEARQPRRGWPVLLVLALAGLLRPEAWLLAALYVAYLWRSSPPRRRAGLVAIAAAAPLLWVLMDLIVTGDPAHSLHATTVVAQQSGVRRGVALVPEWTVRFFGATLREPPLIAIPIGLAFAWRHRRRPAALPVAVSAVLIAVFAAGPVLGLPLVARYIRTPAILLTLFAGLALAGWLTLPPGRERRPWIVAALVAAAAFLAFLPSNVSRLHGLSVRSALQSGFYGDLRRVGESSTVRRAFAACGALSVSDHRPVPFVRYWLDGNPGSVVSVERRSSRPGKLLLLPRHTTLATRFYGSAFPSRQRPPGYRSIYGNRTWRVYASPACALPL